MSSTNDVGNIDDNKQFSVNWSNHMHHIRTAFDSLLSSKELVDVTLYCDGRRLGGHKTILSACSSYFREVFKEIPCQHPVIILKGVKYQIMQDILKFVYSGEVSVDSHDFESFLKTAQLLQISGLSDSNNITAAVPPQETATATANQSIQSTNSDKGNTSQKNFEMLSVTDSVSQNYNDCTSTDELPVKRKHQNSVEANTKRSCVGNIKCEPVEVTSFDEPLLDPLEGISQNEIIDEAEETVLFPLSGNSGQDSPEEPIKFAVSPPPQPLHHQQHREEDQEWHQWMEHAPPLAPPLLPPLQQPVEGGVRCDQCDKVFSHPYSLQQHKPVHAGTTRCPICQAVLSRKYHLKQHMRSRHNL